MRRCTTCRVKGERERAGGDGERDRKKERGMVRGRVTFVISLISVLDAKVIALDVQLHIRKDELVLDKLPDHPKQREEVNDHVTG